MSPADLPIEELGSVLRTRTITVRGLVEDVLERIEHRDPLLRAFVAVDADGARNEATRLDDELDAGLDRGPLHGVPFGVKDIVAVAGWPSGCGSRAADPDPAVRDAPIIARLREAGAIPIGRLATYEYALIGPTFDGSAPPAVNPWDPTRITGGSSSGSAVAVAGGLVRVAIGTDTGGSVRAPTAYCGVVGLKPGRSFIPLEGVHPLSPSLDHVGAIGATVGEARLLAAAMAETAINAAAPDGATIGYARGWAEAAAPDVVDRLDDAVAALSRLGFRLRTVDLPDYEPFEGAATTILQAEAWGVHERRLAARGELYGAAARDNLMSGAVLTADDVATARVEAVRLTGLMDEAMAGVSVLLLPTTLTPAPALADFPDGPAWTPMRTIPFNLTGHPAISVPCGFVDGMPVGMQLAGPMGSEGLLCAIGAAFERATDHAVQRPSLAT